MDCTSEDCKNTRKILKNGEVAPLKKILCTSLSFHVKTQTRTFEQLRDGASGLFMAAGISLNPRETRAPLVEETFVLKTVFHLNSNTYQRLLLESDGKPAVVRTLVVRQKENYVRTEVDGKPSGWTALYIDVKWEVTDKRKKAQRKSN